MANWSTPRSHYDDILIDVDSSDPSASHRALAAAQVALVVLAPFDCLAALVDILNRARIFSPGLRIRLLVASGGPSPSSGELQRARQFAGWVGAADVSSVPLHLAAPLSGTAVSGRCACEPGRLVCVEQLDHLFRDMYSLPSKPSSLVPSVGGSGLPIHGQHSLNAAAPRSIRTLY